MFAFICMYTARTVCGARGRHADAHTGRKILKFEFSKKKRAILPQLSAAVSSPGGSNQASELKE